MASKEFQHYLGKIKGQPNRPNPIKLRKLKRRTTAAQRRRRLVKMALRQQRREDRATALRLKRVQTKVE